MPTNYPGDPTAAESPSVAPDEDNVPTQALPVDGDPPNAATFVQPYKTPADWIAWLKKPFAKAGALAQVIQKWRNARLQDRFTIDHNGFPGGPIFEIQEVWRGREVLNTSTSHTFEKTVYRWNAVCVNTGGQGIDLTVAQPRMILGIGTGADVTEMFGDAICNFTASQGVSVEASWFSLDAAVTLQAIRFGLISPTVSTPFGVFCGAMFYKGNGDTNWQCVCGDGSSLTAPVDSGVAVTSSGVYRLKVEWTGGSVADGSADSAQFFINGALVAQITGAHLPSASLTGTDCAPFFGLKRDTGATARTWSIGPCRINGTIT